jgi:hypothetical protein
MPPSPPPWWTDAQRRRLLVAIMEQSVHDAWHAHGKRLTWEETPEGVCLYLDGQYDSTITLAELRLVEALGLALGGGDAPV